jgi:hypothetical protein
VSSSILAAEPDPKEDHMVHASDKSLGIDKFGECLRKAMEWYGVDKNGFDQKDLLPTAAILAANIIDVNKNPTDKKPRVCINGMEKDGDREEARNFLKRRARVYSEECLVDIYCYRRQADPFRPIITMECEGSDGHSGNVKRDASSLNCDYLWDLFKLLQVASPLRIFLAICRENKRSLLMKQVDALVRGYRQNILKNDDEVFAVIFPSTKWKKENIRVQSWTGPHATRRQPQRLYP